jgi:hypothetical protein
MLAPPASPLVDLLSFEATPALAQYATSDAVEPARRGASQASNPPCPRHAISQPDTLYRERIGGNT